MCDNKKNAASCFTLLHVLQVVTAIEPIRIDPLLKDSLRHIFGQFLTGLPRFL